MATLIQQRSTWWVRSGGANPSTGGFGDYRYFWSISYEQTDTDRLNNRTKIIVDYYLQLNFNEEGMISDTGDYPSGTSTCYINGSSIGSISTSSGIITTGTSWALKYIGQRSTYIYHNNDGTGSFTFQGNGFGNGTSVSTYSTSSGHFPVIPRGSVIGGVSNFSVDSGVTVYSTKNVSSYYDRIQIYVGSTLIKTVNNFSSGTKITFTESELNNIYSIVTSSSATFTFNLSTYTSSSYSTQVGNTSSTTATGSLTIINPSFSSFDYSDTNDKTYNLTGDHSKIIKGYSTLTITIPTGKKATARTRGATISHYIVDGQTLKESSGSISLPIYNYAKDNISVTAVDSRGNSSSTINVSFSALDKFINYQPIFVKDDYDYVRSDNEIGEIVTINFSGTWWNGGFGSASNALSVSYKFKKSTSGSYTTGSTAISPSVSGNDFSFNGIVQGDTSAKGFDIATSYDIVVTISDKLSSKQITYDLHAGEPAIAIFGNKCSLGAAYNESLGGTQIHGQSYIKDNCVIDATTSMNGPVTITGTSYINGTCYISGENIQNFKGTKISSGTSLPSTVTNGSIFILYS